MRQGRYNHLYFEVFIQSVTRRESETLSAAGVVASCRLAKAAARAMAARTGDAATWTVCSAADPVGHPVASGTVTP